MHCREQLLYFLVSVAHWALTVCTNSMVYADLQGSLEFWSVPGRGCLGDQPPINTLGAESLMGFPAR